MAGETDWEGGRHLYREASDDPLGFSPTDQQEAQALPRSLTPEGEDFQSSTVGSRAWACEPHCKSLFLLQTWSPRCKLCVPEESCAEARFLLKLDLPM